MSSEFRTSIRHYTIYCILDEDLRNVYVGMSYAKNPKSRYSSHLRGEHWATKDVFADMNREAPQYYVLEIIDCTGRLAYKHVLAWYHYFEEHGYCVMVGTKAGWMMDNMSWDTQKIYDEICAPNTLDEVLTRSVEESVSGQENPSKKVERQETKQLNIRVEANVIEAFRTFCEERHISQSKGLRILLLSEDFANRDLLMKQYQQEIDEKDAQIASLKKEIEELTEQRIEKESWVLHQRKEWVRIAKKVLSYMLERADIVLNSSAVPSKKLRLKNQDGHQMFHNHLYPSVGDCYEVTICGVVWGLDNGQRTPDHQIPLFICGTTKKGEPIKFRWYSKNKEFIGVPPSSEAIATWGDSWLLGCTISKNNAADLICAVPLYEINSTEQSTGIVEDEELTPISEIKASSLNDRIAIANQRANQKRRL